MPRVRRSPPPPHVVVVDTSVLWDRDKKLSVCAAFDSFWDQNSSRIPMTLHVPEVVFGELHFQQTTSALKAVATISESVSELSGITAATYNHKCNESKIKAQVRAKLEKWLKGRSGSLVPTPVSSIDWASVVNAAIWRKPPFTFDPKDKINEKGFRDAVILETLAHLCDEAASGTTVIFICNDEILRTAAETRLKASKKLLAFESLSDFEAYIKLTQENLTNTFVKSIQSHARAKFFTKGDPNCILVKHRVGESIQSAVSADPTLNNPIKNTLLLVAHGTSASSFAVARQKYLIKSTQFTELAGEREFHWSSKVDFARLFISNEPTGTATPTPLPVEKLHVLSYDVKWKASVKADGRFHDIEVTAIELNDDQLYDANEQTLKQYRFG